MGRPVGPVQAASDEGAALLSQLVDIDAEVRKWRLVGQFDGLLIGALTGGVAAAAGGPSSDQRPAAAQRGVELDSDLAGEVVVARTGPTQCVAVPGLAQAVDRRCRRSE